MDQRNISVVCEIIVKLMLLKTFLEKLKITQIFEKIICEQLVNYLEKHEILYEFQFGFRKGHSTSQAIAEIADNLRNAIDNKL